MKTVMKLIAAILIVMNCCYTGLAQETKSPTPGQTKVCKPGKKGTECYNSSYNKNYKVCATKSKSGKKYYTCGEKKATGNNATNQSKSAVKVNADKAKDKKTTPLTSDAIGQAGESQVCRTTTNSQKTDCYNTKYNDNFKVCKNDAGYYICVEQLGLNNPTYDFFHIHGYPDYPYQNSPETKGQNTLAPQNQSYKNINLPRK